MNPVYDPAYLEDLTGRLYGLVISFSDRLPADQAQWLHHVVDVGEYGLALEDLAAILTYGKIAISDQERRRHSSRGQADGHGSRPGSARLRRRIVTACSSRSPDAPVR